MSSIDIARKARKKLSKRKEYAGYLIKDYVFDKKACILARVIWSNVGYMIEGAEIIKSNELVRYSIYPFRKSKNDWLIVRAAIEDTKLNYP